MEVKIELDSPWGGYYAGQLISGTLECTFDTPKTFRGLYIKFKGRAETSWTESETVTENGKSRTESQTYYGNEEYFNVKSYLLGNVDGDEIVIPAGTYSYRFQYTLPSKLPSSFEGLHGNIRYSVKAMIDRPWKFNYDSKTTFTVISHMDLNNYPEANSPFVMNLHKRFCCFFCKSGALSVDVGLPISGYCSGETMPFEISLENGSNVDVLEVTIKLCKVVTYHSQSPMEKIEYSKETISKVKVEGVNAHSTKHCIKSLEIPPLPPSNLVNCSIIDLDYRVSVYCKPSGCHLPLYKLTPILIGTVPIGYKQQDTSVPEFPSNIAADTPLLVSSITTSQLQHMQMPQPMVNPYPSNPSLPPYPTNTVQTSFPQPFIGPHQYPSVQNSPYPPEYSAAPYPPDSTDKKVPYPSESTTTSDHPSAPSAPQIGNETESINSTVNPTCPYPTAQPVFPESQYSASTIHEDGDNPQMPLLGVYPTSAPSALQMENEPDTQSINPIFQPVYRESQISATTIHDDGGNENASAQFTIRYPTYGFFPN